MYSSSGRNGCWNPMHRVDRLAWSFPWCCDGILQQTTSLAKTLFFLKKRIDRRRMMQRDPRSHELYPFSPTDRVAESSLALFATYQSCHITPICAGDWRRSQSHIWRDQYWFFWSTVRRHGESVTSHQVDIVPKGP
jgi:hypothetical protein